MDVIEYSEEVYSKSLTIGIVEKYSNDIDMRDSMT